MNQGLPMHHKDNEYMKLVGKKSLTHKIAMQAKEKEMIKEVRANFRAKLHNNTHSRKRPSSAGMKMKQKQQSTLRSLIETDV